MSTLFLALLACRPSPPDVGIAPRPAPSSVDLVVTPDPPVGEIWTYRWIRDGEVQPDLIGNRVPAARTRRGDRWKVTVDRRIGRRASEPAEASIRIDNGPPTVQASILPSAEGLQAVTWASDPDGDPVTVQWSWALGDDVVQEGGLLPAEQLSAGQTWTLRAWGTDGEDQGPDTAVTWVADNQAPRLLSASITPEQPTSVDALDVEVEADDPEGDPLSVDVRWFADGEPLYDGAPLPAGLAPLGPRIDAEVTVSDGLGTSAPVRTASLRLTNTPPAITAAAVEPPELAFGVGPSCTVSGWYDPDGDPETLEVRWFIDTVLWVGIGSPSGTEMVKGSLVQCEATPVDDDDAGEPMLSPAVPVVNSPPAVARVFLEPEEPTGADLISVRTETVYDPDGDPVSIALTWRVDGDQVAKTAIGAGASLGGEVFPGVVQRGQLLEVEALPHDGEVAGLPVFDDAVVANAPPEVHGLSLVPSPPQAGERLGATYTLFDADSDPVEAIVEWQIDGGAWVVAPSLPGADVGGGSRISVRVTPDDGFDEGKPAELLDVLVP